MHEIQKHSSVYTFPRRRPIMATICAFCKSTVLESGKRWGYHHPEVQTFKNSAIPRNRRSSCVFCSTLLNDASGLIEPFNEPKPLYRWSVSRCGGIRESPEYLVLTFRPTRPLRKIDPRFIAAEGFLPEREFYFFPEKGKEWIPAVCLRNNSDHGNRSGMHRKGESGTEYSFTRILCADRRVDEGVHREPSKM